MKLVETETIAKDEIVVKDILCNKCGNSCRPSNVHCRNFYGLIEARVTGGYFSEDLEDLTAYTFSICESCLKELFASFALPVEVSDYYP